MGKEHIFNFSVAFADTDTQGIMYHGRYIEVAERARTNWSKDIPIPDGDFGFIVREINIKYRAPLVLADDFVVKTRPMKDDKVCAIMNITIAYLGGDKRPKVIPESIVSALS